MSLDPAIGALIIGCFSLLFAAAASHKLRDIPEFRAVFAAYEIWPAAVRWKLYWMVPMLEIGVATLLIPSATRRAAAALGLVLLIGYSSAIGLNLRAGRTAIACGCGAYGRSSVIAPWMVWRNLSLALILGVALVPWTPRPFEFTDAITLIGGWATLGALYSSTERLLGQAGSAP